MNLKRHSEMKEEEKLNQTTTLLPTIFPKKAVMQSQINDPNKQIDRSKEKIFKLGEFLPNEYQFIDVPGKQLDYFNYFNTFKPFLLLHISHVVENPFSYHSPYTEDVPLVKELIYERDLKLDAKDLTKPYVILYHHDKSVKKFVLKRFIFVTDLNSFQGKGSNEKEEEGKIKANIDHFLQDKFLEYSLMKLFSAIPYSTNPLFFRIIVLIERNEIITELMMDYAGEKFNPETFNKSPTELLEIFGQLVDIINCLKNLGIEHGDIKPDNIRIDHILDKMILRLIDFDIGINQSKSLKRNKGMGIRGKTGGYAAPEIIKNIKERTESEFPGFNPWKFHIFSVGVIMLKSTGFPIDFKEFDRLKENQNDYDTFISKKIKPFMNAELFKINASQNDGKLMENLYELIRMCISFDPDKRPLPFEPKELFNQIRTISIYEIKVMLKNNRDDQSTKLNNPLTQSSIPEKSKNMKIGNPYDSLKTEYDKLKIQKEEIERKAKSDNQELSDKLEKQRIELEQLKTKFKEAKGKFPFRSTTMFEQADGIEKLNKSSIKPKNLEDKHSLIEETKEEKKSEEETTRKQNLLFKRSKIIRNQSFESEKNKPKISSKRERYIDLFKNNPNRFDKDSKASKKMNDNANQTFREMKYTNEGENISTPGNDKKANYQKNILSHKYSEYSIKGKDYNNNSREGITIKKDIKHQTFIQNKEPGHKYSEHIDNPSVSDKNLKKNELFSHQQKEQNTTYKKNIQLNNLNHIEEMKSSETMDNFSSIHRKVLDNLLQLTQFFDNSGNRNNNQPVNAKLGLIDFNSMVQDVIDLGDIYIKNEFSKKNSSSDLIEEIKNKDKILPEQEKKNHNSNPASNWKKSISELRKNMLNDEFDRSPVSIISFQQLYLFFEEKLLLNIPVFQFSDKFKPEISNFVRKIDTERCVNMIYKIQKKYGVPNLTENSKIRVLNFQALINCDHLKLANNKKCQYTGLMSKEFLPHGLGYYIIDDQINLYTVFNNGKISSLSFVSISNYSWIIGVFNNSLIEGTDKSIFNGIGIEFDNIPKNKNSKPSFYFGNFKDFKKDGLVAYFNNKEVTFSKFIAK